VHADLTDPPYIIATFDCTPIFIVIVFDREQTSRLLGYFFMEMRRVEDRME
jgi:hypothetical protein